MPPIVGEQVMETYRAMQGAMKPGAASEQRTHSVH